MAVEAPADIDDRFYHYHHVTNREWFAVRQRSSESDLR